jgi:hypothetical protein
VHFPTELIDPQEVCFAIAVDIRKAMVSSILFLREFDLAQVSGAVVSIENAKSPAVFRHTQVVGSPITIDISKALRHIEHANTPALIASKFGAEWC